MLGRINIKPTSGERIVFTGMDLSRHTSPALDGQGTFEHPPTVEQEAGATTDFPSVWHNKDKWDWILECGDGVAGGHETARMRL